MSTFQPRAMAVSARNASDVSRPARNEAADALPVLAEGPVMGKARPFGGLSRVSSPALVPAIQAAAAAAGGFLAGVAVIGLVNRRHRRATQLVRRPRVRPSRGRRDRGARGAERVQIVGSRSLLVDVHLLAER